MRTVILLSLLISCTNIRQIRPSFNETYETKKGHLFSSNKIIFYPDYNFIYFQSGPAVAYSCGKWSPSDKKKNIVLHSNLNACTKKISSDTVFFSVDGTIVEFKSPRELTIKGTKYWID